MSTVSITDEMREAMETGRVDARRANRVFVWRVPEVLLYAPVALGEAIENIEQEGYRLEHSSFYMSTKAFSGKIPQLGVLIFRHQQRTG